MITGLNEIEARYYEQMYMIYYHTINKNDKKFNQINGISPNNKKKDQNYNSGIGLIPYISNQIDNELLNWLGY